MRAPGFLVAHPVTIRLRRRLRRHPRLHGLVSRLAAGRSGEYEATFGEVLLAEVRPGDCVWDVGANVGLYTERLLERVGASGRVVAIEPAPEAVATLTRASADARRLVVQVALSDVDGEGGLRISGAGGVSSHLTGSPADAVPVRTVRGATLAREGVPPPDVVKLDVEGHEPEAIDGLGELISGVRALFVEVHFDVLDSRGKPNEPARIARDLESRGFVVSWLDYSHLAAVRPGPS